MANNMRQRIDPHGLEGRKEIVTFSQPTTSGPHRIHAIGTTLTANLSF